MSGLLDLIKKKRQALAAKGGNTEKPAKLTSDKNIVRVLPNWNSDPVGKFFHDFGQHFIKAEDGSVKAVYICTQETFGKPCDVCAAMAETAAQPGLDETVTKILDEARPSRRVLINSIYLNGSHANAKTEPVLMELPPSVFDMILAIAEEYAEQHSIDVFSLEEGYDFVITKTGSGRDTKYTVMASPKARPVDASVMSKARDLDAYAAQEYEAGLQKALTNLRAVTGVNFARLGHASQELLPAPSRAVKDVSPAKAAPAAAERVIDSTASSLSKVEPVTIDSTGAASAELDELDALLMENGLA